MRSKLSAIFNCKWAGRDLGKVWGTRAHIHAHLFKQDAHIVCWHKHKAIWGGTKRQQQQQQHLQRTALSSLVEQQTANKSRSLVPTTHSYPWRCAAYSLDGGIKWIQQSVSDTFTFSQMSIAVTVAWAWTAADVQPGSTAAPILSVVTKRPF